MKLLIAVAKNKLSANYKKRKIENQIEILNNCEKNKSEIKVETENIEENKIISDIILCNINREGLNDHMDKKNKKNKLHDTSQDKSCILNYYI